MAVNWYTKSADNCSWHDLDPKLCDNCCCYAYCQKSGRFNRQITIYDIIKGGKTYGKQQ